MYVGRGPPHDLAAPGKEAEPQKCRESYLSLPAAHLVPEARILLVLAGLSPHADATFGQGQRAQLYAQSAQQSPEEEALRATALIGAGCNTEVKPCSEEGAALSRDQETMSGLKA